MTEETDKRRSPRRWTEEELKAIYDKWVGGMKLVDLGKEYDVSFQTIHRAVNKYESMLEPEFCITKDEMKERRARMDRARRLAAARAHNGGERAAG